LDFSNEEKLHFDELNDFKIELDDFTIKDDNY
jgi:hypothetical protein